MARERMAMRLDLSSGNALQVDRSRLTRHGAVLRSPTTADVPTLGRLMYDAYFGTVDYEGESQADACGEIERTLAGEYGPLNFAASQVCEVEGVMLSAALITNWQSAPLLAYSITHPVTQGRGLATACILAACEELRRQGRTELRLVVTVANEPAVRLYRKLGFQSLALGGAAE